jgi:hypothetical protein
LLLYSMQLALTNVGQTTFGQAKDEELVQDTVSEETAFSDQRSAVSENQTPLTTKDTKDTEESKTLPLMNADGTDKKGLLRKETFTAEGAEDTEGSKTLPLMNADGTDKKGLLRKETFTAEGAEDAKESKTLPLIHGKPGHVNADERGLENGGKQVEWKIAPELYRLDTPEGTEAYEASFRMRIVPTVAGGRRPAQAVVASGDPAETYANLG